MVLYRINMNQPSVIPISQAVRRSMSRRRELSPTDGSSLGLAASNTAELILQVERGFSYKALRVFESNSGMSVSMIASVIGVPERTLARRKAVGRITPEESERLLRISAIFEKAVDLFEGDVAEAVNWLTNPRKIFDNRSPLVYARTEVGAREVENLIGRLEHGAFS
jgi:putative toxin-antitoxin system antitoxin component (TIGR02293 family)